MFKLMNTTTKNPLTVEISFRKKKTELILGSIVNKRNRDDINPDTQYVLLNAYLNYKGEAVMEEVFNTFVEAEMDIMDSILNKNLYPLPFATVHKLLNMFDDNDIMYFCTEVYKIKAPAILADVFDQQDEDDGLKTRVQTYIKSDYYDLVVATLKIKLVLPIIAHFGAIKSSEMSPLRNKYILYTGMLMNHPIDSSPAVTKIKGLIEKLISINNRDDNVASVTIIENQISREQLTDFIASKVILQKVAMGDIINDNKHGGTQILVTKMYNYVVNLLQVKADAGSKISEKKALSDMDSNDRESIVEASRMPSDTSIGHIVEFNWAVGDIDNVVNQFKIHLDKDLIYRARGFCKKIIDKDITDVQCNLLAIIFKGIIDPRSLVHITADSMLNLLAIGFTYLWTTGHKEIAIILSSVSVKIDGDVFYISSSSVNRNRITEEHKQLNDAYFPYKRKINDAKFNNTLEEWINDTTTQLVEKRWVPTAPREFVKEVGTEIIPSDIKIKLVEFIVYNERLLNDEL